MRSYCLLELKEQRNSTTDLYSGLKQEKGSQEMENKLWRLREAKKNVFKKEKNLREFCMHRDIQRDR